MRSLFDLAGACRIGAAARSIALAAPAEDIASASPPPSLRSMKRRTAPILRAPSDMRLVTAGSAGWPMERSRGGVERLWRSAGDLSAIGRPALPAFAGH